MKRRPSATKSEDTDGGIALVWKEVVHLGHKRLGIALVAGSNPVDVHQGRPFKKSSLGVITVKNGLKNEIAHTRFTRS